MTDACTLRPADEIAFAMSVSDSPAVTLIEAEVPLPREIPSVPDNPRAVVAEEVPFDRVRCCCAICETDTLHWPGGGDPLVVATIEGSLEVVDIELNVDGSDSAVIAVPRLFKVVAKLEIVEDADCTFCCCV